MKSILFCLFLLLYKITAFAVEFNCTHSTMNGESYLIEYNNGSVCMKRVFLNSDEEKFNLFVSYQVEEDGLVIYNDDESFKLLLPNWPTDMAVSGEISHANESGDVIQEIMLTVCR